MTSYLQLCRSARGCGEIHLVPEGLSSTFTFTVACPIHLVFFLVYLVHFYFTSSIFRFSQQMNCFVGWIEYDNFQKLFTFTDEKCYVEKEGVSSFSWRSEINVRKEKNRNIFGRERVSKCITCIQTEVRWAENLSIVILPRVGALELLKHMQPTEHHLLVTNEGWMIVDK